MIRVAHPSIPIPKPVALVTPLSPIFMPVPTSLVSSLVAIPIPSVKSSFEESADAPVGGILVASLVAAVWICYRLLSPHNKEENELLLKNRGYVYLLRARDYYKVGRSKDFKRRLRDKNSTTFSCRVSSCGDG